MDMSMSNSYSVFCLTPGPWLASNQHKQSLHPKANNKVSLASDATRTLYIQQKKLCIPNVSNKIISTGFRELTKRIDVPSISSDVVVEERMISSLGVSHTG